MKARSTVKKRFRRLSSGLVKRAHAYRRHMLTKKTTKVKRKLRQGTYVNTTDGRKIIQLLAHR